MIKKFKNVMNNVIDRLITMGECCQSPRFLDIYIRALPELPGYPNRNLLIGSFEKEMVGSGDGSKVARLEEEPALSGNVINDKVLVAK